MPGGFDWKALAPDADYPKLNDRLKGLPDYLRNQKIQPVVPPSPPVAASTKPKWWQINKPGNPINEIGNAATAGVNQVGSALSFGLLPAIAGKADPNWKKYNEQLQREHPVAAGVGGGIGLAGTLALPLGNLGTAARGALQATGKVPGIVSAIAGHATTAAIPALASATAELLNTGGNIGKAAKNLAINLGIGIAGGLAGEWAAKTGPRILRTTRDKLNDLVLGAGGVQGRALKQTLTGGMAGQAGFTPQKAEQLKDEIATAISSKGLYGKQAMMEFLDDQGKIWNEVDDAWRVSGAKVEDFREGVMNNAEVMEHLTGPGKLPGTETRYADYAKQVLDDVFDRASSREDLPAVRKMLWDNMKKAWSKDTFLGNIEGDINGALRDAIDTNFVPKSLKQEYPALLTLKKSLAWKEMKIAPQGGGSATAPRQFLKGIIGGIPGGVGSALAANEVKRFDINDPSTWIPTAAAFTGATLGGAALNRLLASGRTQLLGRGAGLLRNLIPQTVPGAVAGLSGQAAQIGGKLAQLGGETTQIASLGRPPEEAQTPVEMATEQTEAQTPPEQVAQAREKVNPVYREKVLAALQNDWNTTFSAYAAPLGIGYEQFVEMVGNITEGFDDPKKTARILFHDPKERDKFLSDYDAALKWQGMDVEGGLEYATPTGFMGMGKHPVEEQLAYQNLTDYLSGTYNQGKGANESERKRIETSIKAIAGTRKTPQEKKRMIQDLLAQYGLDFSQLASLGLYGGENA